MPNPQPGTTLGAYRVEGTIGAGSMGDVLKGIDPGLNRRVAIKILSEKHRDSPELRARFVREGRAVAAISHANVVQVFATGQFDERPYIAMEFLDGTDLGTLVEKAGPMDSLAAAHAVLDGAQGLAAAAKAGLIHRDVKPSNLVRLSDGRVKVTDFGLAKPVDPGTEPALTAMGVVVGTPDYIAPEQARGEAIDERVDIYALGGTLYFLLTGVPPFRTGKPAEDKYLKVVARHLRNPPPDASVTNPKVDKDIADLARAMMAKKPAERPGYDDIVARAADILSRLDPDAVPQIALAARDRSRPIPMDELRRQADRLEQSGDRSGRANRASQPPPGSSAPQGRAATAPPVALGTAPGTGAISPGLATSANDSLLDRPPPRAFPIWLIFLTLACLGLFTSGLVVFLTSSGAAAAIDPHAGTGSGSSATVVKPPPAPGSAAAPKQVPAGMLVVTKPGGGTLAVDATPVSIATFTAVFPKHQQAGKPTDAVTGVSYNEARSYVDTKGGRLLTSDEWDIAANTPGFVVTDGVLEWVDSPDEKKRTVRQHGKSLVRPDKEHPDVTFRMAKDL